MILSGTATRATKAISPSAGVFISYSTYPGVAQLVARLLWELEHQIGSTAPNVAYSPFYPLILAITAVESLAKLW